MLVFKQVFTFLKHAVPLKAFVPRIIFQLGPIFAGKVKSLPSSEYLKGVPLWLASAVLAIIRLG